jgi:hypothetical protein
MRYSFVKLKSCTLPNCFANRSRLIFALWRTSTGKTSRKEKTIDPLSAGNCSTKQPLRQQQRHVARQLISGKRRAQAPPQSPGVRSRYQSMPSEIPAGAD